MMPSEPRRREPVFNLPPVIANLMAVMIAAFFLTTMFGPAFFMWAVETFGFVPAHYAGLRDVGVRDWAALAWPFLTHAFLHGNLMHIALNGVWLVAVGTAIARRLGSLQFLLFFAVCAVLGAATHLAFHFGDSTPVVGASGAVSGCMGAVTRLIFAPTARFFVIRGVALGPLAPLLDRRVVTFSAIWLGFNFVFGAGYIGTPGMEGAAIAWEAHMGGYLAGLLLIPFFDRFATGLNQLFEGFEERPRG